ncbi:hypothetical protein F0562_025097 [Nyssa sinensis]|uniref:PPIase cyclophilin-type domain-containing protein n=1 Tax=Nyssa sinensis TaxID=561372 RepID=A0A5J5BHA7_9ASTE|nr:hypothetical protein F0562_025097 [Nyssa sinensis]
MWQNPKVLQSSAQFLHLISPTLPPTQIQHTPTSPSSPNLKQYCKLSRRELAICTNSSLLLLLGSQTLDPCHLSWARAEENAANTNENYGQEPDSEVTDSCINKTPKKRAFLDISIDGKPTGRIVIGLYSDNVPAGTARQEAIWQLTISVDEWEKSNENCPGTKNLSGSVSIIVRDPSKPPPKLKLVARKGKLEIDEEEIGKDPNGTEFVIATKDSPELDDSALVVGRILEGMEVVEKIGQVKTVQENTSSPYFRVAKLIGDKRAVVAERGFNRPYSKVVVTNCGLLE